MTAFLAEKPPMEFDPHAFCRIDQRDFIFEHRKGAPCVSNLGDRISLRLVTKFGEAVESLGNGLGLDHAIDVSARACGRIAIELQSKRHTLEEKHRSRHDSADGVQAFRIPRTALGRGCSRRRRRDEGALCLLLYARALRSGCATRVLGSGGAPPKAKPPARGNGGLPWPLHPEASSPRRLRPTREGSARREVPRRGLRAARSRNFPGKAL